VSKFNFPVYQLDKTVSHAGPQNMLTACLQPVNNETIVDRLTIKPEVRHKLLASAGQFASCSEDVNLLLRDKDLVVNY
jgi:hypothetical protein